MELLGTSAAVITTLLSCDGIGQKVVGATIDE